MLPPLERCSLAHFPPPAILLNCLERKIFALFSNKVRKKIYLRPWWKNNGCWSLSLTNSPILAWSKFSQKKLLMRWEGYLSGCVLIRHARSPRSSMYSSAHQSRIPLICSSAIRGSSIYGAHQYCYPRDSLQDRLLWYWILWEDDKFTIRF